MNLIVDIGNSVAKFCVFEGLEAVDVQKSDGGDLDGLREFVGRHRPERAILSTVRDLSVRARRELALLPCKLSGITASTPLPIKNDYLTPETLGSDRLAAVVGAWTRCEGRAALVVDAGTCVTYDLLTREGHYAGGNIAPGVQMRLAAMHRFTDRLPIVAVQGETPMIGYSTETAMRSGAVRGVALETEAMIDRLVGEHTDLRVYVTGGDAGLLLPLLSREVCHDDLLAARGLNYILNNQ